MYQDVLNHLPHIEFKFQSHNASEHWIQPTDKKSHSKKAFLNNVIPNAIVDTLVFYWDGYITLQWLFLIFFSRRQTIFSRFYSSATCSAAVHCQIAKKSTKAIWDKRHQPSWLIANFFDYEDKKHDEDTQILLHWSEAEAARAPWKGHKVEVCNKKFVS